MGLLRVRGFTQDDAHIFCTPGQIESEIAACVEFAESVLKTFGFVEFKVELSTWDPKDRKSYVGSDEHWETAAGSLRKVLGEKGIPFQGDSGRGGVLWAEDRHQIGGCSRTVVAIVDGAV